MSTVLVILVIVALVFGGIGLFVVAAKWALIIAGALLIVAAVSALTGWGRRARTPV